MHSELQVPTHSIDPVARHGVADDTGSSESTATPVGRPSPPKRPRLDPLERAAVAIVATAAVGFGAGGFATGASSVLVYLGSVAVIGVVIMRARRAPLPGWLAIGLAVQATANLAGGLVHRGSGVLYNAAIGPYSRTLHTHVLQYDHPVHAFGCFVAAMTLWELLTPPGERRSRDNGLVLLCALGGLGIGAINETLEFMATLAHHGAGVGGYDNTGWDLVSNVVGVAFAARVIQRTRRAAAPLATNP